MSYEKKKLAFDRATKRIVQATNGRLTTKEAQNRLRKAIQKRENKS